MLDTAFLKNARVLITGGTGSFGHCILARLLRTDVEYIRAFSRDEAKQDALRELHGTDSRLEFVTGDVRDYDAVADAMEDMTYVFHAAALKQVPNCERFPVEAVKTNILGSANVRRAAEWCAPDAVVAISTDKACLPLSTMGLSKAVMERVLLSPRPTHTRFSCVRYGNILGSRGSVVPLFLDRVKQGRPLPITHPLMTRFLLCLEDGVDLVLQAARDGNNGELWVRKMPGATVRDLAAACAPTPDYPTENIGVRPGEKMHEALVSEDEMRRATENGDHFIIQRAEGYAQDQPHPVAEYNSANTEQMDVDDIRAMLVRARLL